jgi:choline dehydrogenase-like flavoprotein
MTLGFEAGRHSFSDYRGPLALRADVCIIGAGAGGTAAAAALAAKGYSVVLLEDGSHWRPRDFKPDSAFAFRNLYQGRGTRSLRGNAVIPLPGGRGVGGSTLINSAICFRCPSEILEQWRTQHGCYTLDDARFNRVVDHIWQRLGVSVNPIEVQRNNNLIFKKGAEALRLKGAFLARAAPGCVGCGICQYGCSVGAKSSVDRTLLSDAEKSGRVGVYANCRVTSFETRGDRVVAVTGTSRSPEDESASLPMRVEAETFVLSCGPIGSPLMLLTNGLATAEHCGRHLVIHPTVGSFAKFPQEIRMWSGVTQGYYVDCWDEGYLLQTYTTTPDQYFLTLQERTGRASMGVMRDLRHLASAGVLVHDEDSEGAVRHTIAGPDLTYYLGTGDRERLILGMRRVAEVFFAAGAEWVHPGRVGLPKIRSVGEIEAALPLDLKPRDLVLYASHPMGTCRMGGDPETSVVDPEGRVWGWNNLRVADASVFPTSLGVNPQITTMAMAWLIGESIGSR